jgi:hypothetical protein
MAKKKEFNKDEIAARKARIAKCIQCGGDPPTREVDLQGCITTICNECDEIIKYHKVGDPIKIEKKISLNTGMQDPNFTREQEIKVDTIPGKKGFSNLELL